MKSLRGAALSLVALTVGATCAQAQSDPFSGLKTYDFANRTPVAAVRRMIQTALADSNRAQVAQIEQGLVAVLKDPAATFAGKQEACRMLWEIGGPASVPTLAALLTDEKLSDDARFGLERNMDPSAGQALRDALRSAQGNPLIGLINSVGDRGDAAAVGLLKPLVTNSDGATANAAIAALGKIGTLDAVKALQVLPADDPRAARARLRAGDRLTAAGKGRDAERLYTDLVAHGPAETQAAALHGLLMQQSGKAPAAALADLQSSDSELQVTAAGVVTALGSDRDLAQAITLFPGVSAPVQTALIAGFAARHATAAAPLALGGTQSADGPLRMASIRAAAALGGPGAVPSLAAIAAHGSQMDKRNARESLAQMPGKAADDAILKAERAGDPETRTALLAVLSDRGSAAYRSLMFDAARGTDAKVALAAVKSVGQVGTAADIGNLVGILTTTQSDAVRDAAGEAAVSIAGRSADRNAAAQLLITALPTATPAAQATLVTSLSEIGGDHALAEVTKATTSPNADVKSAAVTALAETTTDPRALPTLWNIAKTSTDKSTRVQALRGYLRLLAADDGMSAETKVGDVRSAIAIAERPEELRQAMSALRDCRIPAAVDVAAAGLANPDVFNEAADAVLFLAAPQKKGNADQPAVKGPGTTAALDKVITLTKDDAVKTKAQSLR